MSEKKQGQGNVVTLSQGQPKRKKVAIVGFAPNWNQAPFDDPEFEIWGLNELYKLFQTIPNARAERWFEIHSRHSPSKNTPEHIAWLQQCPIPVYMHDHYDDMPSSVPYPLQGVTEFLREKGCSGYRYFTNSISWMIALAIYEKFEEIHIYGVDLAQKVEYTHQRPSCEYLIGIAEGMGIKVYIPPTSDLLKTTQLYGFESDNAMRIKMKARKKELQGRIKQYQQQRQQALQAQQQAEAALQQITGAIEDIDYWLLNWVQ